MFLLNLFKIKFLSYKFYEKFKNSYFKIIKITFLKQSYNFYLNELIFKIIIYK